jgi:hypothetical protein
MGKFFDPIEPRKSFSHSRIKPLVVERARNGKLWVPYKLHFCAAEWAKQTRWSFHQLTGGVYVITMGHTSDRERNLA